MTLSRRRPTATLLALLLVLAASPVAAADPTPSPEAPEPALTSPPTVHAEMEAEHRDDPATHVVGPRPQGLDAASLDGGVTLAGGDTLPNGLSHEVLGYLPYWAVTSEMVAHLDYDLLSTIAYFGVPATSTRRPVETHVGWTTWNSATMTNVINAAHAEGVKVVLTVSLFAWDYDYTNMSALLNNSDAADEAGGPDRRRGRPPATPTASTSTSSRCRTRCRPPTPSSSATFAPRSGRTRTSASPPPAARRPGTRATTSPGSPRPGAADALMVMGYDFNWSGSARAGGVSPIDSPYALDVRTAMANYLAKVPAGKLIWGVPYYGRAWTTTGSTVNGRTCGSTGGCTAASWSIRYDDAVEGAAAKGRRWDAVGQVPWYTYMSPTYDEQVQAYYDDAVSLDVKHELIIANGLRGVGIWHLTMDGARRELWDQLWRNYGDLPFRDIDDSDFLEHIIWLAAEGITTGCGNERFCPLASVTRAEMAGFLARALDLTGGSVDRFGDDNGIRSRAEHQPDRRGRDHERLHVEPVLSRPRFVTRAQMASFIDRALDLPPTTSDAFTRRRGIDARERDQPTGGRRDRDGVRLEPISARSSPVSREQMAAFLHRALAP